MGQSVQVLERSWLYNLDAYRRLFPISYVATAHVIHRFQNMPLWGQFLDRYGEVKENMEQLAWLGKEVMPSFVAK